MSDYQPLFEGTHLASEAEVARRVVLAVDGPDKAGKTRFALTAPKPLLFLDFDMGMEGVKGNRHPLVLRSDPFTFRQTEVSFDIDGESERRAAIIKAATPQFTRFYETYHKALQEPALIGPNGAMPLRTLVIDTGSEAWELMRLVEFGTVTKILPHHYSSVNAKMRDLVRAALEHNVNVIWLHQLDTRWKQNMEGKASKTDILERIGFKRMANLVQANILLYRTPEQGRVVKWAWGEDEPAVLDFEARDGDDDLGFRMRIGNCRQDPTLEGIELQNDAIDFSVVAQMLQPDSEAADWEDSE